MQTVLHNLITALRGAGVRISVSETIDAMKAVAFMGYGDREILKGSLSATLAKSLRETEVFERYFDQYFSCDPASEFEGKASLTQKRVSEKKDAPLTQMLLAGDNTGLSTSMREAAREVNLPGIKFFTQKSLYIQRMIHSMGLEGLERDIQRANEAGNPNTKQKTEALKIAKEYLYENVRDYVEKQYSLYEATARRDLMENYLRRIRLSNLEQKINDLILATASLRLYRKRSINRAMVSTDRLTSQTAIISGRSFFFAFHCGSNKRPW